MDFNIYDFLGNPPLAKDEKVEWCPDCLEYTPTNQDWGVCIFCGKTRHSQSMYTMEEDQ